MIQEPYKSSINICLKYSQCISQPKRHYKVLKISIVSPKSCLLLVSFTNSYIIIYILKIQLYKYLSSLEPIKGLINKRKQILILNRDFIKAIIINIKLQPTILLRNKEDRRSYRAYTRPYLTFTKRITQIQTQRFQLSL